MPDHITRQKVTCPVCGVCHYTFDIGYCPECRSDLGGRTVVSIKEFCNVTINSRTGNIAVRPEWE